MKAWVLHNVKDIRYEECERPEPAAGEVLIRVKAAGICGSDIPRIYETGAHKMPLIPGHEFCGLVEETGEDVDLHWLNKRVGIFPLIPCRECEQCRKRRYELCGNYDYIGSRRNGAFAEYVTVPSDNLIGLPDNVSFEQAAMLEPMAVAVHAMRIGTDEFKLSKDISVAICGLGTVGLLLAMFLSDAGYKNLSVIGNKELQRKKAISLGIGSESCCDIKSDDAAQWMNKRGGADLYFDCVGKNETVSLGIEASKPSGRVVLIGNPHSDMRFDRDIYWRILRAQLTLLGSWNSSFDVGGAFRCGNGGDNDDWNYVINRLKTANIAPEQLITHRLSLDELEKGFVVMRDRAEEHCKIMVNFN